MFNEDPESSMARLSSTSLMLAVTYRMAVVAGKVAPTIVVERISNLLFFLDLFSTRHELPDGSGSLVMGFVLLALLRAKVHLLTNILKFK